MDVEDKQLVAVDDDETGRVDPELLIKHPLENEWVLWYFKPGTSKNWNENLKRVASFKSVEDFWS